VFLSTHLTFFIMQMILL